MFSKVTLTTLLTELTTAQESIEKVSVWLLQFREEAPEIVLVWKAQYIEGDDDKKLTLLYLANDVLQNSRRKGTQFTDAFGHILPTCLSECKQHALQINRMLDIWESRSIFHNHVISAMRYSRDEFGMENCYVKAQDVVDSLEELRRLENESSDVLTKLSQRLDTTDFANAFNVTSKKEGDKFAADFDETALFLDEYCTCLSRQTDKRMSMLKKINTTMYQNEKFDESTKRALTDTKSKLTQLSITRKVIVERNLMIDEGLVNVGDDSPDEMNIENLTSEEEDVDIETVETGGKQRSIQDKKDQDLSINSHEDDGIHPEDAIDEQKPREVKHKSRKKLVKKVLPSYEPRKILSYGFRLNPPPNDETAVGFMVMPDGTLCAVPIASHMFLPKPEPEVGPMTPEEAAPENKEEDEGPKTPEFPEDELEEGEVSDSPDEDKKEEVDGVPLKVDLDEVDLDEVDGEPFELPTHSVTSDEVCSSPGSAPSMPSPEVSDEEDLAMVARQNVIDWKQNDYLTEDAIPVQQYPSKALNTDDTALIRSDLSYNATTVLKAENGERFPDDVERPPDSAYSPNSVCSPTCTENKAASCEEGELTEDEKDGSELKMGLTGVSAYIGAFNADDASNATTQETSEYDQFYPPGYLNKTRPPPPQPTSKPAYIITGGTGEMKPVSPIRFDAENRMPPVSRSIPLRPPEPTAYGDHRREIPPCQKSFNAALSTDRRPLYLAQGGDKPQDAPRRCYSDERDRREDYSPFRYSPPPDEFGRHPIHKPCRPLSPSKLEEEHRLRMYHGTRTPPSPNSYSRGPHSPDNHFPRSPLPPMHHSYPRPPVPYDMRPPGPYESSYPRNPPPMRIHHPPYAGRSPPYPDRRLSDLRQTPPPSRYHAPYHPLGQYRDKGPPLDPEEQFHYNDHEDHRFPKHHQEHFLGLGPRFITTGSGGRYQIQSGRYSFSFWCAYMWSLAQLAGITLDLLNRMLKLRMQLMVLCSLPAKSRIDKKIPNVSVFVRSYIPKNHTVKVDIIICMMNGNNNNMKFGPPIPYRPRPPSDECSTSHPNTSGMYGPPMPSRNLFQSLQDRCPPPAMSQSSYPSGANSNKYGPPLAVQPEYNYSNESNNLINAQFGPPLPSPCSNSQLEHRQSSSDMKYGPPIPQQPTSHNYGRIQQYPRNPQAVQVQVLQQMIQNVSKDQATTHDHLEQQRLFLPEEEQSEDEEEDEEDEDEESSDSESEDDLPNFPIQSYPTHLRQATPETEPIIPNLPDPQHFSSFPSFPSEVVVQKYAIKTQEYERSSKPPKFRGEIPFDPFKGKHAIIHGIDGENLDPTKFKPLQAKEEESVPFASFPSKIKGSSIYPTNETSIERILFLYNIEPSDDEKEEPKFPPTGPSILQQVFGGQSLPPPIYDPSPEPEPRSAKSRRTISPNPSKSETLPVTRSPRSRSKSMSISPLKELNKHILVTSRDPRLIRKVNKQSQGQRQVQRQGKKRNKKKKKKSANQGTLDTAADDPTKTEAHQDPVRLVKDLREVLAAKSKVEDPVPVEVQKKVATEEEKAEIMKKIQKMKDENDKEKQDIINMKQEIAQKKAVMEKKLTVIEEEAKARYWNQNIGQNPINAIPGEGPVIVKMPKPGSILSSQSVQQTTAIQTSTCSASISSLPTFLQKAINPNLPPTPNSSSVTVDTTGNLTINGPNVSVVRPQTDFNMTSFCPRIRNPQQRFNNPPQQRYDNQYEQYQYNMPMVPPMGPHGPMGPGYIPPHMDNFHPNFHPPFGQRPFHHQPNMWQGPHGPPGPFYPNQGPHNYEYDYDNSWQGGQQQNPRIPFPGPRGANVTAPNKAPVISAPPQINKPRQSKQAPQTFSPQTPNLASNQKSVLNTYINQMVKDNSEKPSRGKIETKKEAEKLEVLKKISELKRDKIMENVVKKSEELKKQIEAKKDILSPISSRLGKRGEPKKSSKSVPDSKASRFDVPPKNLRVTVSISQPKISDLVSKKKSDSSSQSESGSNSNSSKKAEILADTDNIDDIDIDDLVDHSFGDALEFDL